MKTMDIYLTSQEAQYGCQKVVSLPNQVSPLNLKLKPGMRNNTKLVINNALFYSRNGTIATIPVKVTIHVEQAKNINPVSRKPKGKHRILKLIAFFWFIGLCVAISSVADQNKTSSNPSSGSGSGAMSSIQTDASSGGGQQAPDDTAAPNAPKQTYTDIPAVLLQAGWDSFGDTQYWPKFEFFADGQCDVWINLGYDYCKMTSTYEVYQYSGGLRAIACDISTLYLDNCLWNSIYLLESEDGTWDYHGTPIGFTDISNSFVSANSGTVSTPATAVRDPILSIDHYWVTEGDKDDLRINWVNSGKVSFDFGVYRMFDYENQIGFCTPDGSVYCFLNGIDNTGIYQADGLIRLKFQEHSISLEFLSAIDSEHIYLQDYVGQTYIFQ